MAESPGANKKASPSAAPPAEDAVENLGHAAMRLGFATEDQINEAAATQTEYAQAGLRKKLGEVLLEKKYISSDQLDLLVKNQTVSKKRIGDYELISKLGEGGMGTVYKARQMSMERVVAVKILSPKNASNPVYRERFESEARAVARLNHPNIVTGIDAGHSDGYYYFAMEFVDGETLGQHLSRSGGKLDEREALKFMRQIALALQHAHAHNLLHRDVKPDNILIDRNKAVAKLADLGLAREAVSEDVGATRPGQTVGTPFYMAPEQARGKSASPATDFYSLGGTLFHLLTGQIPFTGATAALIMARHITDPAPNPRMLNPAVSQGAARLVIKCLQKAPADRYQTADELLQDLDRILTGAKPQDATVPAAKIKQAPARTVRDALPKEVANEPRIAPLGRKRKWRRRNDDSGSLVVIIVVVGILAAGLIYAVVSARHDKPKKVAAPVER